MSTKIDEIMNITQEECAEVIQAISKCRRFGIDETHLKAGKSNRENLTEEIGDLLCMIQLMVDHKLIDSDRVNLARVAKEEKLKIWSTIYE